jgi:hypothetical protein
MLAFLDHTDVMQHHPPFTTNSPHHTIYREYEVLRAPSSQAPLSNYILDIEPRLGEAGAQQSSTKQLFVKQS